MCVCVYYGCNMLLLTKIPQRTNNGSMETIMRNLGKYKGKKVVGGPGPECWADKD